MGFVCDRIPRSRTAARRSRPQARRLRRRRDPRAALLPHARHPPSARSAQTGERFVPRAPHPHPCRGAARRASGAEPHSCRARDGSFPVKARLIESREIAPNTRHFEFETQDWKAAFVPGQFLSVMATIGEDDITRAYSIVSPPDGNRFALCANLVQEGRLSPFL